MDNSRENPRVVGWEQGANNVVPRGRQPDGTARHLVNLDFQAGRVSLRAGSSLAVPGSNVKGALALGSKVLLADGDKLIEASLDTGATRELRQIAPGGLVGDTLAGKLYFCTANEALVYDGDSVHPWGVPDVTAQPPVTRTAGGILPGTYKVAVTYTDALGREGGTDRAVYLQVDTGGIAVGPVAVPAGCVANVYAGANSGGSLYLQGQLSDGGTLTLDQLRDDTARCTTEFMTAPRLGHLVCAHNGVLAVATGALIQLTNPFQPHLVHRASGFLQYPQRVGAILSSGGLYVSADKCYMVVGAETSEPIQRGVLDSPAVPGTSVSLPNGGGAWITSYGLAVTTPEGMELVHHKKYAVDYGEYGAAGVLDYQGNQLVVAVMRGRKHQSTLASKERNEQ